MDSNNSAFQEALLRARQLAAKLTPATGVKRPIEEDSGLSPEPKKIDLGPKLNASKNQSSVQRPSKDKLYLNGEMFNGEKVLDLMIPGNKVGFVIGKGGEMIRNLQEKSGAKMFVVQETAEAGDRDKQLRIMGPPDKVELAKKFVADLLFEKEMELTVRQSKQNNNNNSNNNSNNSNNNNKQVFSPLNEYSSRITYFEYPVSPQLIGLVIGKGGDTIRKIQAESGCKVQFDTTKVGVNGAKICQFTGTQDSVNKALEMVKEIVDHANGQGNIEEIRLVVPTSRTGSVIGRGGETIRQLKQQSGCNIELDKNFQSDNEEKCFILRGSADKILYAQQLVTDKVGGNATVTYNTLQNNPLYTGADGPYGHFLSSQIAYANQMGQSSYYWPHGTDQKSVQDQYAAWAQYYAQYYGTQNGSAAATTAAAAAAAGAMDPQQQAALAASWGAAAAATGSTQDSETVYQQWIEYYKAYGLEKEAEAMEQKLKELQQQNKKQSSSSSSNSNNNNNNNSSSESSSNQDRSHHHHSHHHKSDREHRERDRDRDRDKN